MSTPLTGSCHRASDALRRYKSGTGLTSGITSAAPGIILVIAALSLIHCQTFGGNDDERMVHELWQLRGLTFIASVWLLGRVLCSMRYDAQSERGLARRRRGPQKG